MAVRLTQVAYISDIQEVSNDDGSLTMSKVNTVRVFVDPKPVSGRERYAAGQVRAPAMYRFHMRNRAVDERQVITWRGVDYNVRYVGDAGSRDRYIYVDAEKDVAL